MASNYTNSVLYVGMTNNLVRRMYEHKNKLADGFTAKYNVNRLVYYEIHETPENAIRREKAIKNLVRRKKEDLVKGMNPRWEDLYAKILSSRKAG